MDVSTRFRAALPAPSVPLALDGGLGYDDIARTPDVSIVVQVGPWSDFNDGDTLEILWGTPGIVVATRPSYEADANKVIDVFVPARAIQNQGDGQHDVRVRVTNILGIPVTSLPTSTLVKLTVPGGHDPDAHTPYANENLVAPVVVPATIEATTPSAVVEIVAYENMMAGDLVTVRWNVEGNDIFYGPVSQQEADGKVTLSVPIDREALDAGGVGEALKITYQIYDLAHNWSLWSPYAPVDVVDPNAPPPPWVEGTIGEEGKVLDVDILGSASISILVEGSGAQAGDAVTVHWAGATAAGQPLTHETPAQNPTRPGQTLTFSVPNDKVKPLAQGTARAWYTIVPAAGGAARTSARRNLSVIGQIVQLIRPSVAEAKGNTLDPADLNGGFAHATVPAWSGMQVGDLVTLVGEGRRANGDTTTWSDPFPVSGAFLDHDIPIDIPQDIVTPLVDGSLRLYYLIVPFGTARQGRIVRRSALAALRSDYLDLNIREASSQPLLLPPVIPELDSGVLDPAIPGTVHINIPTYTGIATGDRVDVALRGGTQPFDDYLLVASPGAPPSFILPKATIDANRNQAVVATYTVIRTGGGNAKSQPLPFRIGAPAAELPMPSVDEATGTSLDPARAADGVTVRIAATEGITTDDVVSVTLSGTIAGSETTPSRDGNPAGMAFTLRPALIAHNLGTDITIHYTVTSKAGGAPHTSPVLALSVLDFEVNDPDVGKPSINEATGFVLDLATFAGDAHVAVPAWPLMATGQRFWLRASSAGGSSLIVDGETTNAAGALEKPLSRAWLATLADQASLTLELKIAFGGGDESTAKSFVSPAYVVKVSMSGWILEYDFNLDRLRVAGLNDVLYFPESTRPGDAGHVMTIAFDPHYPDANFGQTIAVESYAFGLPPDFTGNRMMIGKGDFDYHMKYVLVTFANPWNALRFAVTSVDREVKIRFKDDAYLDIGTPTVIPGGAVTAQHEVKHEPSGIPVRYVLIEVPDTIRLDSFKFRQGPGIPEPAMEDFTMIPATSIFQGTAAFDIGTMKLTSSGSANPGGLIAVADLESAALTPWVTGKCLVWLAGFGPMTLRVEFPGTYSQVEFAGVSTKGDTAIVGEGVFQCDAYDEAGILIASRTEKGATWCTVATAGKTIKSLSIRNSGGDGLKLDHFTMTP